MSDTYDVGYGKPPKDGQFQPGKSGNPRGRPRGSKNMLTQIRDELSGHITTPDGKKISKVQALARSLYAQGLKGNMQALKLLLLNVIPEVQALNVQEREDESVRGARILQQMIFETFKPLEDEKDREREGAEAPEPVH